MRGKSSRSLGVVAMGAGSLAVGLWLQWVVLAAVGSGLALMPLAALVLRLPSEASWRDQLVPVRVTRGDATALEISVELDVPAPRWVSAVSSVTGERSFLPFSGSVGEVTWPIETSRRGEYLVGPTILEAGDPWGFRRRILAEREQTTVLVVPRVLPVREVLGFAEAVEDLHGETAGSDVFESLREYVVGDPMKTIHWRSSARAGKLMVKRLVDTTIPWLLVVLDVNARAYDKESVLFEDFDAEAFEESVDTIASWAWYSCGSGQRVLVTTTSLGAGALDSQFMDGDAPSPLRALTAEVDVRNRDAALDLLALVDPQPDSACGPNRVEALLQRNGVRRVLFVTGRHTEYSSAWVSRWRRWADVQVVVGHS